MKKLGVKSLHFTFLVFLCRSGFLTHLIELDYCISGLSTWQFNTWKCGICTHTFNTWKQFNTWKRQICTPKTIQYLRYLFTSLMGYIRLKYGVKAAQETSSSSSGGLASNISTMLTEYIQKGLSLVFVVAPV